MIVIFDDQATSLLAFCLHLTGYGQNTWRLSDCYAYADHPDTYLF